MLKKKRKKEKEKKGIGSRPRPPLVGCSRAREERGERSGRAALALYSPQYHKKKEKRKLLHLL